MAVCLLGLGSNLGDRADLLDTAVRRLREQPDIRLVTSSRYHRTSPVGGPPGQPDFLNAAARLETSLPPAALLHRLRQLEQQLGRQRLVRWDARSIDLDILLYDHLTIDLPHLQIPHPRMVFRRFVLQPAVEIAASMVHPPTGWTVAELEANLRGAVRYVALAGWQAGARATVARDVAARVNARCILATGEDPLDGRPGQLGHSGTTGRDFDAALEFLDRQAGLLTRRLTASGTGEEAAPASWISDFSLHQMAALAARRLPGELWTVWRARWEWWRDKIVRPTLVVWLGAPAPRVGRESRLLSPVPGLASTEDKPDQGRPGLEDGRLGPEDGRLGPEDGRLECDQGRIGAVDLPFSGPVFRLPDAATGQAVEEVRAAVLAMR